LFDVRDLKVGGQNFRKGAHSGPEFLEKGLAVERSLALEFEMVGLSDRTRPDKSRLHGTEGCPAKVCGKTGFDLCSVVRRLEQAFAPLREDCCYLVGVFLGDELIMSSFCLEECGVESGWTSVVRMEMELGST
jgi:hypothetical protein